MIFTREVLSINSPLTVGSVFRGIKKELIISVTVTAKVTEEGRKPRKHIRQTAWQKRMKSFEKYHLLISLIISKVVMFLVHINLNSCTN